MPAVASDQGGAVRCVRCRGLIGPRQAAGSQLIGPIGGESTDHHLPRDDERRSGTSTDDTARDPTDGTTSAPNTSLPPPLSASLDDLEDWACGAELRRIRRRYDAPPATDAGAAAIPPPHGDAFGLPSNPPRGQLWPAERAPKSAASASAESASAGRNRGRSSPLVWGALSLGLMAFVCGAVLLGWSVAAGRSDLWSLGMPITLGGQFGLLLGLLLQLESLWEGNRNTVDKLDEVDQRLDNLNHTTTLMSTSHSSPAQAFYVHMAGGASPHLLLADLKGQLDLLATQMAGPRR